jgi:hypothetical protein
MGNRMVEIIKSKNYPFFQEKIQMKASPEEVLSSHWKKHASPKEAQNHHWKK